MAGTSGSARKHRVFRGAARSQDRGAPGSGAMNAASAYGASRATGQADRLVLQHAELVKRIAYHLAGRLPPSVEGDDLIQAGMLGLLGAAAHYAANRGASFET